MLASSKMSESHTYHDNKRLYADKRRSHEYQVRKCRQGIFEPRPGHLSGNKEGNLFRHPNPAPIGIDDISESIPRSIIADGRCIEMSSQPIFEPVAIDYAKARLLCSVKVCCRFGFSLGRKLTVEDNAPVT